MPYMVDSFTLTKVFDNMKRSYRSPSDSQVDELDIKVNFKFSTREILHNSALNADFTAALKKNDQRGMLYALLTDYELNYRQYVIYVVDCAELGCVKSLAL